MPTTRPPIFGFPQLDIQVHAGRVISCVCLLGLLVGGILFRARQICDGHFGYPIDDTYIHMAMAKNCALHGVWGVTPYAFSSSTSSPLFTSLLAAVYFVSGVNDFAPLVINFVFAIALIGWCSYVLEGAGLKGRVVLALIAAIIVAIPLSAMTLVGMEHVLHMLLTLMFVHFAALLLTGSDSHGVAPMLLALTPLLVMARYEGTFLVLIAGLLFLMRGRWGMFLGLGFLSIAPLAGYALIAMRHGWYALPNSLLLKANLPGDSAGGLKHFILSLYVNCLSAPHLPLLLLLAFGLIYLIWKKNRTVWVYSGIGLVLFLVAGVFHILFARVGWYFRYEAYLVALGGITLAVAAAEVWDSPEARSPGLRWAAFALGGMLLLVLGVRSARSIYLSPRGIRNIFDQQYQTARFIKQFYPNATIIVNDIGMVCYLTDARVLDAIGLGDMAPAVARIQGRYSKQWVEDWAKGTHAEMAIGYPDIEPPSNWLLLGTWTIPERWVVGRAEVNVYAISPRAVAAMRENLKTFYRELPRGVSWTAAICSNNNYIPCTTVR